MVLYNQGDHIKCCKSTSKIELFYLAVNFIYHRQRSAEHAYVVVLHKVQSYTNFHHCLSYIAFVLLYTFKNSEPAV